MLGLHTQGGEIISDYGIYLCYSDWRECRGIYPHGSQGGLLFSVSGVGEETLLEHRLHLSVDILAGVAQFLVEHLVWG